MIIKDIFKRLEISNSTICFKSLFKNFNLPYSNIDYLNIKIPKFDSIPGSGCTYSYLFLIFTKDAKPIKFNIVLERKEEKELLSLLKEYNINHSISYYDNSKDAD